jgi:hypothetical protein
MISNLFLQISGIYNIHQINAMSKVQKKMEKIPEEDETDKVYLVKDKDKHKAEVPFFTGELGLVSREDQNKFTKSLEHWENTTMTWEDFTKITKKQMRNLFPPKTKKLCDDLRVKDVVKIKKMFIDMPNKGLVVVTDSPLVKQKDFDLNELSSSVIYTLDIKNKNFIILHMDKKYMPSEENVEVPLLQKKLPTSFSRVIHNKNRFYMFNFNEICGLYDRYGNFKITSTKTDKWFSISDEKLTEMMTMANQAMGVELQPNQHVVTLGQRHEMMHEKMKQLCLTLKNVDHDAPREVNDMTLVDSFSLELKFTANELKDALKQYELDTEQKLMYDEKYENLPAHRIFDKAQKLSKQFDARKDNKSYKTIKMIVDHYDNSREKFIQSVQQIQDFITTNEIVVENQNIHNLHRVIRKMYPGLMVEFLAIVLSNSMVVDTEPNRVGKFARLPAIKLHEKAKNMSTQEYMDMILDHAESLCALKGLRDGIGIFCGDLFFEYIQFREVLLLFLEQKVRFNKTKNMDDQFGKKMALKLFSKVYGQAERIIGLNESYVILDKKTKELKINPDQPRAMEYLFFKILKTSLRLAKNTKNENDLDPELFTDVLEFCQHILPNLYTGKRDVVLHEILCFVLWNCAHTELEGNFIVTVMRLFFADFTIPTEYPRGDTNFVSFDLKSKMYLKLKRKRSKQTRNLIDNEEYLHPSIDDLKNMSRITFGPFNFRHCGRNEDPNEDTMNRLFEQFVDDHSRNNVVIVYDRKGEKFVFGSNSRHYENCVNALSHYQKGKLSNNELLTVDIAKSLFEKEGRHYDLLMPNIMLRKKDFKSNLADLYSEDEE